MPTLDIIDQELQTDTAVYPSETFKITYRSAFDGKSDWCLYHAGDPDKKTIVYLHGSFSHADQIFTREDIRIFWLERKILPGNYSILSINMRDTSYMSPAASQDLTDLLDYCTEEYQSKGFILLGGSGGASSAIAYACLYPEKIDGVIALGMCDIVARLDYARKHENPVLQELARVTFQSYGGSLEEKPELYQARSILEHVDRLTMPIVLTIGEHDPLIPVVESRKIKTAFDGCKNFQYYEVPGGDHDSAVWVDIDLESFKINGVGSKNSPE
jgi:pimeloyl-ACP methyl ester carboxylesterase